MKILETISKIACRYFIFWVLLASIFAFYESGVIFLLKYVKILLTIIMFSMGMTLSLDDFRKIIIKPKNVIYGIILQYTIMPLLAFFLVTIFKLPKQVALGIILLGSCPGGTSSNVMVYLSRGDLALSVSMTIISTIIAPIMTPLLTLILAGSWIEINVISLFISILQIVFIPIILGIICNSIFRKNVKKFHALPSLISIIAIILIIMAVISANASNMFSIGIVTFIIVILHNILGYTFGYLLGLSLKIEFPQRKALSIEVGMQNSGLATTLAIAHFGPLAALPGAIFSVWHNISGSLLATFWSRKNNIIKS